MPQSSRLTFAPRLTRLPSGITVVTDHVPSVDSAALGIWVKAGTRDEPTGQSGVAHLVEHTSFRRTKSRSNRKIAREFEDVGAYSNAYTTKEETCYYVRTLSEHTDRVMSTLADVVFHPVFDASDIEKERSIITEEIRSYEDEAEELIFDLGERQLFGNHPLGAPIVGTVESIVDITATDVRRFHRDHYHGRSLVITASGNVDHDHMVELAEKLTKGIRRKTTPQRRRTPRPLPPSELVIPKHVQQAHVLWHLRTDGHRSKHRAAMMVLNVILGDGMSSRLNVRIRETRGIAYSIYSQLQLFQDVGTWSVYAGLDEARLGKGQLLLEQELRTIARDGVKAVELKRAQEQLRASKIMSLESLSSRMTLLGKGLMDEGKPEDPYATIDEIRAVTVDELNALASELCQPDAWSRCLVIPQA